MKPPVFSPTIRKTGVDRPTPTNLVQVIDQIRGLVLELQGSVGPPELRAVRLQELMRAGVVIRQPEGGLAAGVQAASATSAAVEQGASTIDGGTAASTLDYSIIDGGGA